MRLLTAGALVLITSSAYCATTTIAPSANVQTAVDSIAAAGGGTVNVTSGSATLAVSVTMKSGVTLSGAGNPTTTWNQGSSQTTSIKEPSGSWSNITLQNFKVNGPSKTGSTAGPRLGGGSNTNGKFSNLQALNEGQSAALINTNTGSVTSCNFHDSGASNLSHGLYFSGGNSTVISGCTFANSPEGTGLHLNFTITGGSAKNCTTNNNGQDGHNYTSSGITGFTVDTCTANDNAFYGFSLQNSSTGTIKNCIATGNPTADYFCPGWTQSNNH